MNTVTIQMVAAVMSSMVFTCVGFLMDTNCIAPSPCHCTRDMIQCYTSHLTAIPKFKPATVHMDNLTIMLPGNDLTTIPANAFRNINTTRAITISILFQTNKLYNMDMDAFAGIEDAVVELCLEDNRLTSVPAALTRLTKLKRLHMQSNPITTIDQLVMSRMSITLEEFSVPAENLTSWPYALSNLRNLIYLLIYGIPFHHLPTDAFFGFGSSLTELHISGSLHPGVPSAVCFLRNLKQLDANAIHLKTPQQMLLFHEKCQQLFSKTDSFIHI